MRAFSCVRACVCVWLRGQDLNLRPSGYEPDELPGCSTPRYPSFARQNLVIPSEFCAVKRSVCRPVCFGLMREDDRFVSLAICRPGSDLLSRVLRRSTIGAGAFHGRVRNGNGCSHPAITTRSTKGKIYTCSVRCKSRSFVARLACPSRLSLEGQPCWPYGHLQRRRHRPERFSHRRCG